MKKIYSAIKNENVQAAIIITSVFLLTGVVALFIIYSKAV